jgi:hypothetical protein
LTFVSSPDGRFKAALGLWSGGGAISPSCNERVFVVAEGTPDERVTDDENLVFGAECETFTPQSGRALASPDLSWRSPGVLAVRFSILGTASTPATIQLRRQAASGQVMVEYEVGW